MNSRGKLAIGAILLLAVAAALFAGWFQYRGTRRALDFWGPGVAQLLTRANQVEAWKLVRVIGSDEPSGEAPRERLRVGDATYRIVAVQDVAEARGVNNIRRALTVDATFDWEAGDLGQAENWQYALDLHQGQAAATLLFDFESRRVALAGHETSVALQAFVSREIDAFLQEQFAADSHAEAPAAQ